MPTPHVGVFIGSLCVFEEFFGVVLVRTELLRFADGVEEIETLLVCQYETVNHRTQDADDDDNHHIQPHEVGFLLTFTEVARFRGVQFGECQLATRALGRLPFAARTAAHDETALVLVIVGHTLRGNATVGFVSVVAVGVSIAAGTRCVRARWF